MTLMTRLHNALVINESSFVAFIIIYITENTRMLKKGRKISRWSNLRDVHSTSAYTKKAIFLSWFLYLLTLEISLSNGITAAASWKISFMLLTPTPWNIFFIALNRTQVSTRSGGKDREDRFKRCAPLVFARDWDRSCPPRP